MRYDSPDATANSLAEGLAFTRACRLIGRGLPPAPAAIALIGCPPAYADWLRKQGHQPSEVESGPSLGLADASQDAVLLLGPLQQEALPGERLALLSEVRRVLKPGGIVFATANSRFAWLLEGLWQGRFAEPGFAEAALARVENPLAPTASAHRPDELLAELRGAGLVQPSVVGLEGPAWLLPDAGDFAESELLDAIDQEAELMAISRHLLATAFRPA